ncbi:MAG: HD-GYP domain-containing protein, partial [bacterium]
MRKVDVDNVESGSVLAMEVKVGEGEEANSMFQVMVSKFTGGPQKLQLSAGTELTEKQIKYLEQLGVPYVFIRDPHTEDLDPYIHDEDLENTQDEVLNTFYKLTDDLLEGDDPESEISNLYSAIDDLIESIKKTKVMMAFTTLKSHDDYTAKHSLDVAKLALNMAMEYRQPIHKRLQENTGASTDYTHEFMFKDLGVGALLHDLGKFKVPHEILNKPGKLDDKEWEAVKEHPKMGQNMIKELGDHMRVPAQMPALLHHEQYSGNGYPTGKSGDRIHIYGRITACCDVYSSLTSNRSYRMEKSPSESLNVMKEMQNQ